MSGVRGGTGRGCRTRWLPFFSVLTLLGATLGACQGEPAGPATETPDSPPPSLSTDAPPPTFSPQLAAAMADVLESALDETGLESGPALRELEGFIREANGGR